MSPGKDLCTATPHICNSFIKKDDFVKKKYNIKHCFSDEDRNYNCLFSFIEMKDHKLIPFYL